MSFRLFLNKLPISCLRNERIQQTVLRTSAVISNWFDRDITTENRILELKKAIFFIFRQVVAIYLTIKLIYGLTLKLRLNQLVYPYGS